MARHPTGGHAELAQVRIDKLQKAQVAVQPDRAGKVQTSYDARFRDGDTYEFETRDGLTGSVIQRGTIQTRIKGEDEVEGAAVSGNVPGARATRAGAIFEDGGGTYDPPWVVQPAGEFQQGKRVSGRAIRTMRDGNRFWIDYETKVVGRETIQTKFGAIDTWVVETKQVNQHGGRLTLTFWYDPDWGYSVRMRSEFRGGGAPDIRIREMVARSRKS
jgi:hypothetical protein